MRQRKNHRPARSSRTVPPPAPASTTGKASSGPGFFGTMAQGFAFGTGSSMAHRTVDAVVGDSTPHSHPANPDGVSTTPARIPTPTQSECYDLVNQYQFCLSEPGQLECRQLVQKLQACLHPSG